MKSSLRVPILVLLPTACVAAIAAALVLYARKDDAPLRLAPPQELSRNQILALPTPWKPTSQDVRDGVNLISEGSLAAGLQRIEAGRYDSTEPYQRISRNLAHRIRQALSDRGLKPSSFTLDMLWIELGAPPGIFPSPSAGRNARYIRSRRNPSDYGSIICIYQFFSERRDESLEVLSHSDRSVAGTFLPELLALKRAMQTDGDSWELAAWTTLYLQHDIPDAEMHPLVALELWHDLLARAETSYQREVAAAEIVRALEACGDQASARQWRNASPMVDLAYRAQAARLVRHRIRSRYMR
jgi:hypothetical protein